ATTRSTGLTDASMASALRRPAVVVSVDLREAERAVERKRRRVAFFHLQPRHGGPAQMRPFEGGKHDAPAEALGSVPLGSRHLEEARKRPVAHADGGGDRLVFLLQ